MSYLNIIKRIVFCMLCLVLTHTSYAEQENYLAYSGKYITLKTANKQLFTVYVAGPKQAKQAILLIHGWWGLNQDVQTWADQFALAGYRIMAIDLYNSRVTKNPVKARKLMNSIIQSEANEKYASAIESLSTPERKIAVIGSSYGGSQAIHAVLAKPEGVSAAIIYYPYGELVSDKNMLSRIKAPILGHFAEDDFFLTADKLTQFTSAIKTSGKNMTANMYKAKHGFNNPAGKNFDKPAHKLALERTYQFLNQYLK